MFTSVDLPHPILPTMATNSPRPTDRLDAVEDLAAAPASENDFEMPRAR